MQQRHTYRQLNMGKGVNTTKRSVASSITAPIRSTVFSSTHNKVRVSVTYRHGVALQGKAPAMHIVNRKMAISFELV